jgi:hypothetical protein
MKSANQKIVSLSDYKKACGRLELADVAEFIKFQQDELRDLDQEIAQHLIEKRRLKETESMRVGLAKINGKILEAADWLEDELSTETDPAKTTAIEKLRKVTGQLVSRSEVTRKVLVDDMANSRYYEQRWLLDPARIISLVFIGPVGIDTFIEKFVHVANADKIGQQVGESAVAVGLYLAFKKYADSLIGRAYKRVKQTPANVRKLAVVSAFEIAVRLKPVNDIEPRHPKELRGSNRVIISLKR